MKLYFGVDIGGTQTKTALVSEQGEILDKRSFATAAERGLDDFSRRVRAELDLAVRAAGVDPADVQAVGVGVPGFLDVEQGVLVEAVNLGWVNLPLVRVLADATGRPVAMENDANVAALGEAWIGAGRGAKSVLCATVGTGVGGGIVIGGRLYRGVNGMAGEIGHLTVRREGGHRCNCGKLGCLETEASASAIIREARRLQAEGKLPQDGPIDGAEDVFALWRAGHAAAAGVVREAARWLGYGLALCAITLNPDAIVIGGGVSKAGEAWLALVREAFVEYALPLVVEAARFQLAELGNDAGVIGAARLAAHHVESL
ncbi:glucokinase [Alicyclobacillus cellulosilyticus]|uniref:Glucokinase n=1 Tax=Alicyclobacillus cellulosilyticus TaxID=1003997 RepID=A0A917NL48_9BACL|nr:ROK family glucokinase [Alicyclobacillus cellulosilyticus]GGJ05780.1 glucokinase [Alicyclobacillus cellulosilyticus]